MNNLPVKRDLPAVFVPDSEHVMRLKCDLGPERAITWLAIVGRVRIAAGQGHQSHELMCAQVKAWNDLVPEALVATQDLEECFLYAQRRKGFDTFPIQAAGIYQSAVELGKIKRRGQAGMAIRICSHCGQTFSLPTDEPVVFESDCKDCIEVEQGDNSHVGNLRVTI